MVTVNSKTGKVLSRFGGAGRGPTSGAPICRRSGDALEDLDDECDINQQDVLMLGRTSTYLRLRRC
jgi:hypothetical protein